MRGMSGVGLVVVFAHAHIFLSVKIVLHLPVVSNGLSSPSRWQLRPLGIGDGIGYFVVGLTRAMMKAGSFYFQDLPNVRKRGKFRVIVRNHDCAERARFLATMAVVVGAMRRRQALWLIKCARGGSQKSRLVTLEGEKVEPFFSTMIIAVSLLVCAASPEISVPRKSKSASKSRAADISLVFSGTPCW